MGGPAGFKSTHLVKRVKSLGRVQLFATPWTVAHQVPLSMELSKQEYWSELPFPSPGDLPDPGIEPRSLALQADSLLSEHWECPIWATGTFEWLMKTMQWLLILLTVKVTLPKCPHDLAPMPLSHISGPWPCICPVLATFLTASLIELERWHLTLCLGFSSFLTVILPSSPKQSFSNSLTSILCFSVTLLVQSSLSLPPFHLKIPGSLYFSV